MNDFKHLKNWFQLSDTQKLEIFIASGEKYNLHAMSIEKDWWVTHVLAIIFSMSCSNAMVFKGGTSLSKAWNLIERFSEDIDLALDKEYLGFSGNINKKAISKLRYASYEFLTTKFINELNQLFNSLGFTDVTAKYHETINHDQDPVIIEIYYPKLTEKDIYLRPGIIVEIGSRSLKEPFSQRIFKTMMSEIYENLPFSDNFITIPTVNPERTFLEKIFLLHEEFQRPPEKIRVERLSRHLYDIEKIQSDINSIW